MFVSVCSLGLSVIITSLYYRALHVVYKSWRRGDETVAALEVLFTRDAVSPDGFSQTAYIILHAGMSFASVFVSSKVFLLVIAQHPCHLYLFLCLCMFYIFFIFLQCLPMLLYLIFFIHLFLSGNIRMYSECIYSSV